ncbi:MAG: hypothetical protein RIE08_01625 [Acidimicrobiales bacterium]
MHEDQSADLEVTFIDELHPVAESGQLTFGRDGDITVDDANAYMHRRVGSFVNHDGTWWIRNDGRTIEIVVVTDTGARISLDPGASQALTGTSGLVRFEAGGLTYELEYSLHSPAGPPSTETAELTRGETLEFGTLRLNDEQRQMLVALAEPQLRDPAAESHEMPTNAEVAHRLGWSLRKFDRKLDYICRRLDEQGVRGVRGRQGVQATDRRRVVIDHVLRTGLIGEDDLSHLDETD